LGPPDPNLKAQAAYFSALAFALAASQSDFDNDTQPIPLQLFMPLQLFFADLHSDVPLQEFTPEQWTVAVAVSAATDTLASPDVNNIAAAAAIAALDNLLICMMNSSIVIERSDIAAPLQDPANEGIITQLSKLMLYPISGGSRPTLACR
jgi:hypothetical protein